MANPRKSISSELAGILQKVAKNLGMSTLKMQDEASSGDVMLWAEFIFNLWKKPQSVLTEDGKRVDIFACRKFWSMSVVLDKKLYTRCPRPHCLHLATIFQGAAVKCHDSQCKRTPYDSSFLYRLCMLEWINDNEANQTEDAWKEFHSPQNEMNTKRVAGETLKVSWRQGSNVVVKLGDAEKSFCSGPWCCNLADSSALCEECAQNARK